MKTVRISVYLVNGNVYNYDVDSSLIAQSHAADIISKGYKACNNKSGILEYHPPHRIAKIKLTNKDIKIAHPYIDEGV